jgi:hypothetical protein
MTDIEWWFGLGFILWALICIHSELKDIHELLSWIEAKQPHLPKNECLD